MLPAVGRSHGQASEVGRGKGGGGRGRGGEGRLSGRRRFPILLARSGSVVAPEKGFVSEFHVGWRSLGRFVDADCSPRILCPIARLWWLHRLHARLRDGRVCRLLYGNFAWRLVARGPRWRLLVPSALTRRCAGDVGGGGYRGVGGGASSGRSRRSENDTDGV